MRSLRILAVTIVVALGLSATPSIVESKRLTPLDAWNSVAAVQDPPLAQHDTIEPGKYAMHTDACQPWGDEDRTDDGGLRNMAKRWIAKDTTPVLLTFPQLKSLQDDTDADAATGKKTRAWLTLTNRHAGTRVVSEGDRVAVSGFLNRVADGAKAETVNCKKGLGTRDGRDIHLNIGPAVSTDEYTGIVIELIPQLPVDSWAVPKSRDLAKKALGRVMKAQLQVLAIGSLTYDNEHTLKHQKGGQPKRMSLWELHPVLQIYVCPSVAAPCDPGTPAQNWETLGVWATKHPK